jgi:hypothetical protein
MGTANKIRKTPVARGKIVPPKVQVDKDAFADDELGKDTYMIDIKTGKQLKLDDTIGYERIVEYFGQ